MQQILVDTLVEQNISASFGWRSWKLRNTTGRHQQFDFKLTIIKAIHTKCKKGGSGVSS